MERDHILLGLLGLSACLHLLSVIFGLLFYTTEGGLFQHLAGNLTEKHIIQFSPQNWIYIFWNSILWIWITLLLAYLGANVFRDNKDGKMYCNPPLVTREVAGLMSLNSVLQIIWLFLWDMETFVGTTILLFLHATSSWATLVIFTIRFLKATPFLFHHTRMDLWIFRILVQNGMGTYATWVTIEFLFKLSIAVTASYPDEATDHYPSPSAVGIIVFNFILAITFPLEMLSWEKPLRYLLSPSLVILSVITSVYVRLDGVDYHDYTMRIYALIMLIVSAFLFVAKTTNMVYRHFKNPLVPYV